MKRIRTGVVCIALGIWSAGLAHAQVSITAPSGGVYAQDFNTLGYTPDAGTVLWTNDVSLPGWLASVPSYKIYYNKSSTIMYSYGLVDDPERALGSVVGSISGTIRFGVLFRNDSGRELVSLTVAFAGEQWRDGQSDGLDYLYFHYKADASPIALADSGFIEVPSLTFTSPINNPSNSPLNGNLPANRVLLSRTFDVSVPAGHYVLLRWSHLVILSAGHGLAVDDLTVSWKLGPKGTLILLR